MKIVFDTYAWIEYFEGSKKGVVVEKHLNESEVLTPSIVLLELSYKANKKGWDLQSHLNFIKIKSKIIGIDENFVLQFGKIYNDAKSKIKDFGIADAIILTTAKLNNASVLTGDSHFSQIKEAILL